jgi:hypothetical protein
MSDENDNLEEVVIQETEPSENIPNVVIIPNIIPDNSIVEKDEVPNEILDCVKFIIHRFELNDPFSPSYYIVGFKIVCDQNQRESFIETTIGITEVEGKSDDEICLVAYDKLKHKVIDSSKELLKKKYIIGSEFIPPRR